MNKLYHSILRHPFFTMLIFMMMSIGNTLLAQPYYFRHYQVEEGLSYNTVYSATQDSNGFMWFGTRDGLNRFDGYDFKIFRNVKNDSSSIGNNYIFSLCSDLNGDLWAGTRKGLYQYHAATESFSLLKFTGNLPVSNIQKDKHGTLWFIANDKLCSYHIASRKHIVYHKNNNTKITSITITADNDIWISNAEGELELFNHHTRLFTKYDLFKNSAGVASRHIETIYYTGQHSILIGTSNQGVKLFDLKSRTYKDILVYNINKTEIFARHFIRSSENEYWIATESGIFIYNIKTGSYQNLYKNINDPYSLSDNAVYALFKDKNGGMWACTYFGGVNYYSRKNAVFEKFFPNGNKNALQGNVVRDFYKDDDGNLWIGTEDAGINKFNPRTNSFSHFYPTGSKGAISYTNIHGLMTIDDHLWLGTYQHGLDVLNIKTNLVVKHYRAGSQPGDLKSNFITTVFRTRDKRILVGTALGLYTYLPASDNFKLLTDVPSGQLIYDILEDRKGTIWVATLGNGVFFFHPKTGEKGHYAYQKTQNSSLSSNTVTSIFEDSSNTLWFTTENGGLCRFREKTKDFAVYHMVKGFQDRYLFKILEDNNKRLWISTSHGLVCFDPETSRSLIFTKNNGLLSDQFNYNSGFKDEDGMMYFGSLKGFIRFNPHQLIQDLKAYPVYLTGIQINNKELAVNQQGSPLQQSIIHTSTITLKADQSTFSINFAALNYAAPEMTEYAYRLEGLDQEWIDLKSERKIYFTKLPAGTYTLKIKSLSQATGINSQETTLAITILPPFYASKLAYFCYTVLLAAVLYFVMVYFQKKNKIKALRQQEVQELEKEKGLYESKIEFFTHITHEIRTPLTLINGPLEKLRNTHNPEEMKEHIDIMELNTKRLINLTDQLLDFRRIEIAGFSLSFSKADIPGLFKNLCMLFENAAQEKGITYQFDVPAETFYANIDTEAFHKILNNLLGNAIKYARSYLFIQLIPPPNHETYFKIVMKNDGHLIAEEMAEKIFTPFFRLSENNSQPGTGIGLPLARSLAELHGGRLTLDFQQDELNTFLLSIPVKLEKDTVAIVMAENPGFEPQTTVDTGAQEVILLVEDNLEMQDFIAKHLKTKYGVITAANGREAIDLMQQQTCQLVISDITMPVMDGFEFCRFLKTDITYSHIPVILLTAKSALLAKLEGLEIGADAYIEKPFSPEHLSLQISNLLKNRNSIKEHFAQSPLVHLKSMAYSKADESFLKKLDEIIVLNLTDTTLDIEMLADKLNMSKATLFRKIKAVSNLSPNELINITRLKRAAGLLTDGEFKIYQIAEMVGFSSSPVFTRSFHKQFGMSPSEYISTARNLSKQ